MKFKVLNSLEKTFPNKEPIGENYSGQSCLQNEKVNFQISILSQADSKETFDISYESKAKISLYEVCLVPSNLPCYNNRKDDNYLSYEAGIYPDLLKPIDHEFVAIGNQWRNIWVEAVAPNCGGNCPINIKINDTIITINLTVLGIELPKQKLLYTQWFHYDCLATYYKVDIFSEKHWEIIDNFQKNQREYGSNMILTPVLTPPLDTQIGGERPTVQLVDIEIVEGEYIFNYEKLKKFIKMSLANGYTHFEISHPFSQWGAKFAPKVMATANGNYQQIFGWDTLATSEEYVKFIRKFITELKIELKRLNILDNCYFHISDEPGAEQLESYSQALNILKDIYEDCNVIDALSSYDFYKLGLVKKPVPANDHIEKFIENNVQNLWAYYCCAQCIGVSNRFFAMPSSRNRIIATQLYKFDIEGFLHWGYNFYYTQYSVEEIDPFYVTDAGGAFPSGDAFSVYPSPKGEPYPSIRQFVFNEALQDLCAFQLLESLTDKQTVINILENETEISFSSYPKGKQFILKAREKVNELIAKNI